MAPQMDTELTARRVNGAVAADLLAQAIRARLRAEASSLDPQDIFRRIEAIEAAIFALSVAIDFAIERSDPA